MNHSQEYKQDNLGSKKNKAGIDTQGDCGDRHPGQGQSTQGSCYGEHHVRCRKSFNNSKNRTGHEGNLNHRLTAKPVE